MTATDELRRLLDERGVEWDELVGHPVVVGTEWHDRYGCPCTALEHADDVPDGMLSVQANLAPEQAVEATLGNEDTYTREDVESAFVSGYSLGSLPIGSDPRWDENKQTVDEHMAELGWVRKATLGRGECTDTGRYCFTCSECGWAVNEPHHVLGGFWPNYCPNCGRKVRA